MKNLLEFDSSGDVSEEQFEVLFQGKDVTIERIISTGQASKPGFWYDQDKDEWVALLQGQASIDIEGQGQIDLKPGDYLFIPAKQRHRVTYTSSQPPCVWLAIHGNLS